jgi:prolyl oligopeptidase
VIEGAKYASPSWTPDGLGFYYEYLPTDPAIPVDQRPGYTEIRFHRLGEDPKQDLLVHPRTGNPSTFLGQSLSEDGRYLFVYVMRGWNENDVYVATLPPPSKQDRPAAPPTGAQQFRLLVAGKDATYSVLAHKDAFYILTNEGASRQRVFKVAAKAKERAQWKEVVPEDPEASLQDLRLVGGQLVLSYLRSAASELRVVGLDGRGMRAVSLPGLGTVGAVQGLSDDDELFFGFSSFTIPAQVYKTSVRADRSELWAKVDLPIDPQAFTVEQVWYSSKDGTPVSMFLVHRKDLVRDGSHPVLLYGYGGFNISLTPAFRSTLYPWLEAGGVYAVPNLRGGGEYGKAWHDAGKGHQKQNVFDDFIAAAEHLVTQRYTRPERLAIWGGSNGGLLVGAAMVQRPDLFGAVVCAVPLLDMVRYHLFGSGRTWIPEYGTAEDPKDFAVLRAYSPYHGVTKGARYPALLMLSADHDDRVDPMHARKFVAAVQAAAPQGLAWLRVEANAGHGGADRVKQTVEQYADQWAFLFQRFGMQPKKGERAAVPQAGAR